MRVIAGGDFAFVRDSAAVVFVAELDGIFSVRYERVWVPTDKPLKPSLVFREAMQEIELHGAEGLCADDHYYATVAEVTEDCDVQHIRFPSDAEKISQAFVRVRVLFGMGAIDLTDASPQLVSELKEVTGKPLKSGVLSIQHPRRPGSHGDRARAFVAGMYALERADLVAFRSGSPMVTGPRRMSSARHTVSADGRMRDLPRVRQDIPR